MTKLEQLITLPQAAQRLGLSVEALTRLVDANIIKANIHEGEVLIQESQVAQVIAREQFADLAGIPITMAEASKKYNVSVQTIWNWTKRDHLIKVLDSLSYPIKIDESGVAYCAQVYKARRKSSRIFDKKGNPYQPRRPDVIDYRKRKARQAQRARA